MDCKRELVEMVGKVFMVCSRRLHQEQQGMAVLCLLARPSDQLVEAGLRIGELD